MAGSGSRSSTKATTSTISTAPLHKIKFANWITSGGQIGNVESNGLVVAIEGVSFAPNLDAGVIELGPKILPKMFSLSLVMTVLHTEQVGWNLGSWLGSSNYPYTEEADLGEGGQAFGPTQEEFQQQEEAYQQAAADYMLGSQQGANAASGFMMSEV